MVMDDLMATMPAISMWQPYASLMFAWDSERGEMAKAFETRGFALPERLIGQPVAIHATKAFAPNSAMTKALRDLCYDMFGCGYDFSLPRSAIIGIVTFERAKLTADLRQYQPRTEIAAGDWRDESPNCRGLLKPRWAWPAMSADLLAEPVSAKGKQGWWRTPALRAHSLPSANEAGR